MRCARTGKGPTAEAMGPFCREVLASCVVLNDELDVTLDRHLGTLRAAREHSLELVELNREVTRNRGKHLSVATGSGNLEHLTLFRTRLDVDLLARLHTERGAVNDLAVNEDVAVDDHLASLSGRAGKACAEHECVEAHLEELNEVLTGEACGTASLFEDDAKLLLAETVLGAQTLLLAQTHCEVGVGLAARAAVLAGSVGTLLHRAGQ